MDKFQSLRIIFMGSPDFAVASLDALVKAGANIVAVVTTPDKPAGRGLKINESSVKKYAAQNGLHLLQPPRLKDPSFIDELKALNADLQVVVAFRMLPEIVWNMPPMGTINLHGSLLPHYRGAAPINWAIINGEKETGVTTFKLKHEIDTGDILLQEKFDIGPDETAGQVHDKMKDIGALLVLKTVKALAGNEVNETPQQKTEGNSMLKAAPKITTESCRINWGKSAEEVYDLIRGLSPYPTAFTMINEKMLKIFSSQKEMVTPKTTPGDYETDGKTFLKFACVNGYIQLGEVQMEGKRKMPVTEFLKGFRIDAV